MNSIVPTQQRRAELSVTSYALEEQLGRMETGAEIMKLAMTRVSEVYIEAEYHVTSALGYTERIRQSGPALQVTPEQAAAYESLRTRYIDSIGAIAEMTSTRIINQALRAPLEPQSTLDRILGLANE